MQVVFSYSDWMAQYPQFATTVTTAPQAQNYFNQATLYWSNNDGASTGNTGGSLGYPGSPLIPYDTTVNPPKYDRLYILYLLTAHVAQLAVGCVIAGAVVPPGPLVGRINSATQGSVSVGVEMPAMPGSAAWFQQTQYGLTYWQRSAPYRSFRYRVAGRRY